MNIDVDVDMDMDMDMCMTWMWAWTWMRMLILTLEYPKRLSWCGDTHPTTSCHDAFLLLGIIRRVVACQLHRYKLAFLSFGHDTSTIAHICNY